MKKKRKEKVDKLSCKNVYRKCNSVAQQRSESNSEGKRKKKNVKPFGSINVLVLDIGVASSSAYYIFVFWCSTTSAPGFITTYSFYPFALFARSRNFIGVSMLFSNVDFLMRTSFLQSTGMLVLLIRSFARFSIDFKMSCGIVRMRSELMLELTWYPNIFYSGN